MRMINDNLSVDSVFMFLPLLRIRVSFFRGAGIPAPVDESPLLTTAELYLRPGGSVNCPRKATKIGARRACQHKTPRRAG